MKKHILVMLSIFVIIFYSCSKDENPVTSATGTITGKVTNATGDSVIAGAFVTTTPPTSSVQSDASGNYIIESVSPNTYTVIAKKNGYNQDSVIISVTAGNTTKANIALSLIVTNVLYLHAGDPATWTIQGGERSQYAEIQRWGAASLSVTTKNLTTTIITEVLLSSYQVLRLTCPEGGGIGRSISSSEATAIDAWVRNGGRLFADISWAGQAPFITPFGIDRIEGVGGGSSGLSWYYHGAPLTFGPVSGPVSSVNQMACEVMDRPVLQSGNSLNIAATIGGYPAIVYGEFASGKVVIVFVGGWSWDATSPGNAYRANIFLSGNLQFLENVINYLSR